MTIEEAFGEVLRELRSARSFTQQQLAFEAELDRTYISLLERGHREPGLTTLLKLSTALDVRASDVVQQVVDLLNSPKRRR